MAASRLASSRSSEMARMTPVEMFTADGSLPAARAPRSTAGRQLGQVTGGHGADGGTSGERHGDVGSHGDAGRGRAGHGGLHEGGSGRFGDPHAFEPGFFHLTGAGPHRSEVAADDDAEIHG